LAKTSSLLAWQPPRMDLIFQVWGGSEKQAVVCVSARKLWNSQLEFDLISVDLLGSIPRPVILVAGSEANLETRTRLRESVQLNRRYVNVE
jgi:hypothetical protein